MSAKVRTVGILKLVAALGLPAAFGTCVGLGVTQMKEAEQEKTAIHQQYETLCQEALNSEETQLLLQKRDEDLAALEVQFKNGKISLKYYDENKKYYQNYGKYIKEQVYKEVDEENGFSGLIKQQEDKYSGALSLAATGGSIIGLWTIALYCLNPIFHYAGNMNCKPFILHDAVNNIVTGEFEY